MRERLFWRSSRNDYTDYVGTRRRSNIPINIIADYVEDQDWRKYMSSLLGTESALYNFGSNGVHWVSKWPGEVEFWDSNMWLS